MCGILGLTVAVTGRSEKALKRLGLWGEPPRLEKIYLHPGHHAGYYPGAASMTLKLIFSKEDGRVLGAQAVGREGVEKRIDVISMAIQNQATVFDLEEAELCYAPQYGAAKDPVNMAGFVAANILRGDYVRDAPLAANLLVAGAYRLVIGGDETVAQVDFGTRPFNAVPALDPIADVPAIAEDLQPLEKVMDARGERPE